MSIQIPNLLEWRQQYEWDEEVKRLLNTIFGKELFLDNQREIINMILSNKDVFVCMQTGYGKSLTFQLPALMSKGCTIVVMPTISLIFDQIMMLRSIGLEVDSTLNNTQMQNLSYKVTNGLIKLLYTTPGLISLLCTEKLDQNDSKLCLQQWYKEKKITRFVMDEAHCVSKWGRDFRHSYLKLKYLKQDFPNVPIVALSATVTSDVKLDVVQILNLQNCLFVQGSNNRPNLFYEVRKRDPSTSVEEVYDFITSKYDQKCGIIYCLTQDLCVELAKELRLLGIKTGYYHGGQKPDDRATTQLEWMLDDIHVIVATFAFGMGINKPDCRFVIHYQMPRNLEAYIQESGRAGRDGQIAHCVLFYNQKDYQTSSFLMNQNNLDSATIDYQNAKLAKIQSYCLNNSICRRQFQLEYLEEIFDPKNCNSGCDVCLKQTNIVGEVVDLTQEVKLIMAEVTKLNITRIQLENLLKGNQVGGAPAKQRIYSQSKLSGFMSTKKEFVGQLLDDMMQKNYVQQKLVQFLKDSYTTSYSVLISDAKKLYQMKEYKLTTYKQKASAIFLDIKSQALQKRADVNFSTYLKKDLSSQQQVSQEFSEDFLAVQNPDNKQQITGIIANKSELFQKMRIGKKGKLFHPTYGYCSELQFLTLEEKLRTLRKAIYKQNEGEGLLEAIITNQSIAELVRKLPINQEELLHQDIYLPSHLKNMHYMKEFLELIDQFQKIEKIDKNNFHIQKEEDLLQGDQVYTIIDEEESKVQLQTHQKPQIEQQQQTQQLQQIQRSNVLEQRMNKQPQLKNKKNTFL